MLIPPDSILGTLLERFVLNLDLLDVAARLPHLTWQQIIISLLLMTFWKLVCDQLDRLFLARFRRWLSLLPLRWFH